MTKTLTEQWRDGTLPLGTYYIVNINGVEEIDKSVAVGELWNNTDLKEVLAPVPSYDKVKEMSQKIERLEFDNEALEMAHNEGKEINAELVSKTEQLEKKLKIATKALKDIQVRSQRDWNEYDCMGCARKALYDIEMEGVK